MMLASLTQIAFVMGVACLNLAMGFGIAALCGRGPWSRHARSLRGSAACGSPAENSSWERQPFCESGLNDEPQVASTDNETTSGGADAVQLVANGIEHVEQRLQKMLDEASSGCAPVDDVKVLEWSETIVDMATRFHEIQTELEGSSETDLPAAETRAQAIRTVGLLHAQFLAVAAECTQGSKSSVEVTEMVSKLITNCREMRGATNAALFSQLQP